MNNAEFMRLDEDYIDEGYLEEDEDYLDEEYRPSKRTKRSRGAAATLNDSSTARDRSRSSDLPFHIVRQCDLDPTSNLQAGTKISPTHTVETINGDFLKITRISQDELGTIKLHGNTFIPRDRAHGPVPQMENEVYWLCHTAEESNRQDKSVSIQQVKQLRELDLITHDSPAFSSIGERPTFIVSGLPTLFCRWRYTVVTADMINAAADPSPVGGHPMRTRSQNKRKRSSESGPSATEHVRVQAQESSASLPPPPESSTTHSDAEEISRGAQDDGLHIAGSFPPPPPAGTPISSAMDSDARGMELGDLDDGLYIPGSWPTHQLGI